eukprot:TRINITY_DN66619_c0_g1_i1.p1 TRINITY_DN66619_c0_g1~~TRINITY_DN66619_c0_g1_i1.p1  ORF type:complete len:761 (+),score=261.29 TRINITY_DN66619_c0_g1_i1:82-2364(+)
MPIYPTPDKELPPSTLAGRRSASPRRRPVREEEEAAAPSSAIFHLLKNRRQFAPRPPPRPPHPGVAHPLQHTKIQVQVKQNISKQHQMEDDGLLIHLYNQLHKKTWSSRKEYQGCPGARCPDTVVYEHNFPQHWYHYDAKQEEIQKRPGSYLDTAQIYDFFKRPPPGSRDYDQDRDIVAQYLYSETVPCPENPDQEDIQTSVEFFTVRTLHDFLHNRKSRPDGVLQRFVVPKGRNPHNFQIQAVWSPRVTALYKRTNMHRLRDHTVGIYERAVTADGPPHYTREDLVSGKTRDEIVKICRNFCTHFESTEKKPVARVVLYFKVDERDHVWILWASSLRIGATKHSTVHNPVPLSLSTKFATPDKEVQERRNAVEGEELDRRLLCKDVEQYRLSGDWIFATTHCRDLAASRATGPQPPSRPGSARPMHPVVPAITDMPSGGVGEEGPGNQSTEAAVLRARPHTAGGQSSPGRSARSPRPGSSAMVASERAPFLPSPRRRRLPPPSSPLNPFHQQAVRLGLEGCVHLKEQQDAEREQLLREQREARSGAAGRPNGAVAAPGRRGEATDGAPSAWGGRNWWTCDPEVTEKHQKLVADEELVQGWVQELVYQIYSHTLNHGTSQLYVAAPPEDVWQVLCADGGGEPSEADRILAKLGMHPYEDDEADASTVSTKEYYFGGSGCASRLCSDGVNHRPFFLQHMQGADSAKPMAALSGEAEMDIHTLFENRKAELRDWARANCRAPGDGDGEEDVLRDGIPGLRHD